MMKKQRPRILSGKTYEVRCGCGPVYVTCNDGDDGQLFEVFARLGKSGGCGSASAESVGVLLSIGLRSGVDAFNQVKGLAGIQCHRVPSCMHAIAEAVHEHIGAEVS